LCVDFHFVIEKKEFKMKITTRQIVVAGALGAISILLGVTKLGFIPFVLGTSITIMHVPVIVGAILEGPWVGTAIGLIFGIFSLIWAYIGPNGPGDIYFQNPLISILPRLFIGLSAYMVFRALRKISVPWILFLSGFGLGLWAVFCYQVGKVNEPAALLSAGIALGSVSALAYSSLKQETEVTAITVAAIVGTLTNTVLVLGMMGLLGTLRWVPTIPWGGLLGIGLANGIPEAIGAVLITVAVVAAWKQIEFGRKGARIFRDE
jgi:uncharacterized membrane protein